MNPHAVSHRRTVARLPAFLPTCLDEETSVLTQRTQPTRAAPPVPSARERMIVQHHKIVRSIATRMALRLPSHVDVDELVNVGMLGLIDAIDRYDAARGVPFRAYAEIRIRGAIVDALRDADWTPRAVRRNGTRLDQARTHLRRKLGHEPSREEMADELEVPIREYDRMRADSETRRIVSLDAPTGEDADTRLVDLVGDDTEVSALDHWMEAERHVIVAKAVDQLPERERLVMSAYYQKGLSLKEIGVTIGVTESRVCQIHGQALKRLQRMLREDADE